MAPRTFSPAPLATPAPSRLDGWRRDTPGCRDRIHLNNAGAALMPQPVLRALIQHLEREAAIGGYEAADEAEQRVREAYELLGRVVGAGARNMAIVENATVAFNQAISAFDFRPGDRIITTRTDYPSNQLVYLSLKQRAGVETVRADDLPDGGVDPESVRRLARDPRTRLVALSWVPTNSGLVQDAHAVGAVCAELGVPYLIDACQAVGQLPVDVTSLQCDFLGGTGRKFLRGPRGIGFLYVSDRMLERGAFPLLVDMRGADWTDSDAFRLADGARRFENWEYAYALVLGLAEAARYSLEVGTAGGERARQLAAALRGQLARVRGVRVLDRGRERCAIVTVNVEGRDAAEVKVELRRRGINTSSADRQSGVLDMDEKQTRTALRFSPHYYNTEDELDAAVTALAELARP
ncbi:MAG TPA: aminotransferase class V-fold PLP-dependent enzyme [Gemmatimonadales bacterium]|nr:aminotransferase class V-fold PLP-dependent enzyme [Gemmatimonadales bacterium]